MNMNYRNKIAGRAFASNKNWEQVDGIAGTEITGWILFTNQQGEWKRRNGLADDAVKKSFKEPAKLAAELKKAKSELRKAEQDVEKARHIYKDGKRDKEQAEQELLTSAGKTSGKESTAGLQADRKSASERLEKLQSGLSEAENSKRIASAHCSKVQVAYDTAADPLLKLLGEVDKQAVEDWAMNYNVGGIPPRVLLSNKRDWALINFGEGFFWQYLITWSINAFVSPLRERTVLNLEDLVAFFLTAPIEQEKPPHSNTRNGEPRKEDPGTMKQEALKQKLLEMLNEFVQRFKSAVPSRSGQDEGDTLRPFESGSLDFLADPANGLGINERPITQEVVDKLKDNDVALEKAAKEWQTSDIFQLWRVLPKRGVTSIDKAREALARVLAERITKSGDGRDKVISFLAEYQALMDQNGMDKSAPHPLYYMILSRKSRGAISTLIDACEDETLLDCTDWTVDKGAYEPRVWQTLLDGLTDRLTLKFHRDIYDADGFAQSRRIGENLKEMIEAGKLPEELREAYRWRLVSLVREALCRAEAAASGQAAETGGAAQFIGWVETDFVQNRFVQENPQMKAMFTQATTAKEG